MDLVNETQNQHFVSQAEQRLNAINPNAKQINQSIYAFRIVDRYSYKIGLMNNNGIKIRNNLSFQDVFSFDIVNRVHRHNFEAIFQCYEENISLYTCRFINKLQQDDSNVKEEFVNIFTLKLLNTLRNPYSIERSLRIFPDILKNSHPTDPHLYREYEHAVYGNRPHQERICQHFGITLDQYSEWLRCLFLLLNYVNDQNLTAFEDIVVSLFNDPNLHIGIRIFTYDQGTCLLPDIGFVDFGDDPGAMVMAFNLYSRAFVKYAFLNMDTFLKRHEAKVGPIPQRHREGFEQWQAQQKIVNLYPEHNDLDSLRAYNAGAVLQSHSHVYGSAKKYCGIKVV